MPLPDAATSRPFQGRRHDMSGVNLHCMLVDYSDLSSFLLTERSKFWNEKTLTFMHMGTVSSQGQGKTNPDFSGAASVALLADSVKNQNCLYLPLPATRIVSLDQQ